MTTTAGPRPAPASPPRHRLAFLGRPGWLTGIGAALAFAAACWLILAPWQFDRNAERSAQNAAIDAALNAAPVPATSYLSTSAEPTADQIWRQVTATGSFLPQGQAFVRLRQDTQGNPAAEVVVPFRLTDGTLLLVDRGYVPDADAVAGVAPAALPTGEVTVTGRVQTDQPDPAHRAPVRQNGHTLVYGIDAQTLLAPYAGTAGAFQGFAQLVVSSPGVLTEIGVPQTDDGPFLSYALQWCAFGAMALLALGFFIYREATDPRDEQDETGSAAPASANPTAPVAAPVGSPPARPAPAGGPEPAGSPTAAGDGPDPDAPGAQVPEAATPFATAAPARRDAPAVAAGPAARAPAGPASTGRTTRRRKGFDRSDLYD